MGRISMPQGRGNLTHNRRAYAEIGRPTPTNIDSNRSHLNATLVDHDIKELYQELFGDALAEYNDKQKRADRKIADYYDHISKSKNGEKLFYEDVLQWGDKDIFENSPRMTENAFLALQRYVDTFEQRNPNLRLVGAYIHMDEASPHLHLDYVPVAHGYTRGLKTRNSLDRAMKEMGFVPEKESRKNNATKLWKERERAYFGEICREMGLEVEKERKARGSLSVDEYKEIKDKIQSEVLADARTQEKNAYERVNQADKRHDEILKATHSLEQSIEEKSRELSNLLEELEQLARVKEHKKTLFRKQETVEYDADMIAGLNASIQRTTQRWHDIERHKKEIEQKERELAEQQASIQKGQETLQKAQEEVFAQKRNIDTLINEKAKEKASRVVKVLQTQIGYYEQLASDIILDDGTNVCDYLKSEWQSLYDTITQEIEDDIDIDLKP